MKEEELAHVCRVLIKRNSPQPVGIGASDSIFLLWYCFPHGLTSIYSVVFLFFFLVTLDPI